MQLWNEVECNEADEDALETVCLTWFDGLLSHVDHKFREEVWRVWNCLTVMKLAVASSNPGFGISFIYF
jgi:hypothetical protein